MIAATKAHYNVKTAQLLASKIPYHVRSISAPHSLSRWNVVKQTTNPKSGFNRNHLGVDAFPDLVTDPQHGCMRYLG